MSARTRRSVLSFVAVLAGGTVMVAGPARADTSSAASEVHVPAAPQVEGGLLEPGTPESPMVELGAMLDRADARARRAELEAKRSEAAARAEHRVREHQAAVRASRAGLRSEVVRPVAGGYHLTARFDDQSGRWGSGRHTGLDFACAVGTPVLVVADGVVTSADYSGAYGNRIEVRHADGTVTTYNHLSQIEVHGGAVTAGQVIGRVGATGNTTGPHLHFEVRVDGTPVDPEHWLAARFVAF